MSWYMNRLFIREVHTYSKTRSTVVSVPQAFVLAVPRLESRTTVMTAPYTAVMGYPRF